MLSFLFILFLLFGWNEVNCGGWRPFVNKAPLVNLFSQMRIVVASNILLTAILCTEQSISGINTARAADAAVLVQLTSNDPSRLKQGLTQLDYLLSHWDEKTTYCNFGEFQRELLLPENKEKLMKAAAETGLLDYDKSATMNIMCRRDPEMVRAYIGLKEENPTLLKAERLMKRPEVLERVDPDHLESYTEAVEAYAQAIAAADSLSYEARTDYASTETNTREALMERGSKKDYLGQAKDSVITARNALAVIVEELQL